MRGSSPSTLQPGDPLRRRPLSARHALGACDIGEAANRISPELHGAHPEVPWRRIVAQRKTLFHVYDRLDLDLVWKAIEAARKLEPLLQAILEELPEWTD